MNNERIVGSSKRWLNWPVGATVLIAAAAIVAGFVLLPQVKPDFVQGGLWDAICRAAGVPSSWASATLASTDRQASQVVWEPELTRRPDAADIGRGATLAMQCAMCHGARGLSEANAPNLAGQYPEVIYKQLRDYKGGQRSDALMQALATGLRDRDIRDLAAYYAYLPKPVAPSRADGTGVPALVRVGDPMRNIAPCASCHGGYDQKLGSPWLEGMPKAYLAAQLRNFASSTRRNDMHGVMRNMVRQMTGAEIEEVAGYYSSRN